MPNKCIIPNCGASHRKFSHLKFFSFVRNNERRLQWIEAIQKGTGIFLDEMKIDINDRVCSLHFQDDDIITESKERGDFKFLKKEAVPSIFGSSQRTSFSAQHKNQCRFCLNDAQDDQITLGDSLGVSQISVIDAVLSTFAIDLTNPNFPQKICSQCFNLVTSSYHFKTLILESESKLRQQHENEFKSLPLDINQLEILPPAMIKIEDEVDPIVPAKTKRKARLEVKKEVFEDEAAENLLEVQLMEIDEFKPPKSKRKLKSKYKAKDPKKIESRTCKNCHYAADSALELLKHVDDSKINCSALYEPSYECYICRKKFMLDVKKREHVRRDHVDYASKDCPHCIRARLKTSTAYELHVRQHFAQPDFLCTNCGKGFFKKELYDLHMRQHDDNFWLYCDHCEYKCKIKSLMTTHLKHHFGIRPFVCDKCSKPFHKSNALNQHIFQVHKTTNKGCYRCQKCDYCFLHRRDIIRHNVYCEGQSKNPVNCPRVRFAELDPSCAIKELLNDESHQELH